MQAHTVPSSPKVFAIALSTLFLGVVLPTYPAYPGSWSDVDMLKEELKKTGTLTVDKSCTEKGTLSFYEYEKSEIDQITICINNIEKDDPDEYWESLAHEATHVMQACTGDYALNDKWISRAYRELQAINPTSVDDMQLYGSWDKRQEIEARWMEFQQPGDVITLLQENCKE
jgi:hypothetical protein